MTKRILAATALALSLLAVWFFAGRREPVAAKVATAPVPARTVATKPAVAPAVQPEIPVIAPAENMHIMLRDLRAAFRFGKFRQKALREILGELSEAEVLAALQETFGAEGDNDITHVLLEHLASVDAPATLAFAREHRFGTSPPWWMSVIGGLKNPRQVLPELMNLPVGDARTSFLAYATGRWATTEPDAALDYAVQRAPIEAQQAAINNSLLFAARTDPAHAFDLARVIAPEFSDAHLLASIATDWAANNYAQAQEKIRSLPDGTEKQSALAGLVAVTISRDLPGAFAMIPELKDQAARSEFYMQATRYWLRQDGAAARTWLSGTTELSAEQKTAVLQERPSPVL